MTKKTTKGIAAIAAMLSPIVMVFSPLAGGIMLVCGFVVFVAIRLFE